MSGRSKAGYLSAYGCHESDLFLDYFCQDQRAIVISDQIVYDRPVIRFLEVVEQIVNYPIIPHYMHSVRFGEISPNSNSASPCVDNSTDSRWFDWKGVFYSLTVERS